MTLIASELWASGSVRGPAKRFAPTSIAPKKFAAVGAAPTYEQLTPVYRDMTAGTWKIWSQVQEVQTLTFDATGGVYTVGYDGVVSPSLTYLNTSGDTAVILAALEALPGLAPGSVSVTRGTPVGNVTIFTVTFTGPLAGQDASTIAITETLTGGGASLVVATATAGSGTGVIDGFIAEPADGSNPALMHATGETLHNVIGGGTIHYDDIPLPAGENQTLLDTALAGLRTKGFIIQGLASFR